MSSLDPTRALPPLPELKSFALTHILYNPSHPLSIPLTLFSLTPIFIFVSYLTLVLFTRRLGVVILAVGQTGNEVLNLVLKRLWKGDRPYKGYGEVGHGWGMPSSHSQAAGFTFAWAVGYALTASRRYTAGSETPAGRIRRWVYLAGCGVWSALVAYSRWHLHYHTLYQVVTGYSVGLAAGSLYFLITESIPLSYPTSPPGKLRAWIEHLWTYIGGIGGYSLGGAEGGWGEVGQGHTSKVSSRDAPNGPGAEPDSRRRGKEKSS